MSSNSFLYLAAKLSLWSPFAGLLIFAFLGVLVEFLGMYGQDIAQTYLIICTAIWSSGLILGGIALYASKRVGRKGILGRALTGVILDAILLGGVVCVLVVVYVPSWKAVAKENRDKRSKAALQIASKKYLDKYGEVLRRYQSATAALTNPPVLNAAFIKTKEDLAARMETERAYIAASREALEFMKYSISLFAQQITSPEITEEHRLVAMKAFERKMVPLNPAIIQLQEAELDQGHATLRMLICMKDNWGKWEYDAKDDLIKFNGTRLPRQYVEAKKDLDEMNSEVSRLGQEVKKLKNNKLNGD